MPYREKWQPSLTVLKASEVYILKEVGGVRVIAYLPLSNWRGWEADDLLMNISYSSEGEAAASLAAKGLSYIVCSPEGRASLHIDYIPRRIHFEKNAYSKYSCKLRVSYKPVAEEQKKSKKLDEDEASSKSFEICFRSEFNSESAVLDFIAKMSELYPNVTLNRSDEPTDTGIALQLIADRSPWVIFGALISWMILSWD